MLSAGHSSALVKLDEQRIVQKYEKWQQLFDDARFRKNMTYLTVGVASALVITVLLYQRQKGTGFWAPSISNGDGFGDQASTISQERLAALILQRQQYYRTFQGRMQWGFEKGFEAALVSVLGAWCLYALSSSGSAVKRIFARLTGFQDDLLFSDVAISAIENTKALGMSLRYFLKQAPDIDFQDSLYQKLHDHIIRGVMIDHGAFVDSCAELIALIMLYGDTHTDQQDHQVVQLKQSCRNLVELINDIIQREEEVINSGQVDSQNVLVFFKGLHVEMLRVIKIAGTLFYGKNFTMWEEPRA